MFSFLPLINNSGTTGLRFFITKPISNHIIKYNQYFIFLVWIIFFNIFINIIHIIFVSIKALESFKCFNRPLSVLSISN